MQRAVEFATERNVKVHITLNTLVKDSEMSGARKRQAYLQKRCRCAYFAGPGVLRVVKDICPDIELHAYTQMSVESWTAYVLQTLGFSRAVLPTRIQKTRLNICAKTRRLSLKCSSTGRFVCGSGQCLLSAFLGSRSGNRGLCAQPCPASFCGGKQNGA